MRFACLMLIAAATPLAACSPGAPEGATVKSAAAAVQTCSVADMGTAAPDISAFAQNKMDADAALTDVWALWSSTSGLVTEDEAFDVARQPSEALLTYRRQRPGQAAVSKSAELDAATVQTFSDKMATADKLCDVNNKAFDGTTHHYVHVRRGADGSLAMRGAFIAVNPDVTGRGEDQANAAAVFFGMKSLLPK